MGFLCHGGFHISLVVSARCASRCPRWSVRAALRHYGNQREQVETQWEVRNKQQVGAWGRRAAGFYFFPCPQQFDVPAESLARTHEGLVVETCTSCTHDELPGLRLCCPDRDAGMRCHAHFYSQSMFASYLIAWSDLLERNSLASKHGV